MPDSTPSKTPATAPPRTLIDRLLAGIERAGNALPHPALLFLYFTLGVIVLSGLASWAGFSVAHPATGKMIEPVNLLSVAGLHQILKTMVTNFTGFAPLGTVLVSMIGIGVAERAGLINTALRVLVLSAPRRLLTMVVVFAGVMSNMASDVGYVLLVPLGAMIFLSVGRHPLAGLAAAFAGVSGGFSANLLLGTIDPLLAGLTQEAARIIDPKALVSPASNWYFLFVSTFVVTAAGTFVTERIVEPRLGRYTPDQPDDAAAEAAARAQGAAGSEALARLDADERRGLLWSGLAGAAFTLVVLAGTVPGNGFLRDPQTGDLLHSPFMDGIVPLILVGAIAVGVAYGFGARTYRNSGQVVAAMSKSLETLAPYLVLCFFAAQFVALFRSTNLGVITAIEGANALKATGIGGTPLMLAFVALTALVNLLVGSASAKWAIMAPIFVPMFMLLGYTPELTQAAYRVGDSVTNIISPMMSYFPLIIAFTQKYDRKAGLGTLIATMLPYSLVFFIVWTALLLVWVAIGLPVGPGAGLYLEPR